MSTFLTALRDRNRTSAVVLFLAGLVAGVAVADGFGGGDTVALVLGLVVVAELALDGCGSDGSSCCERC